MSTRPPEESKRSADPELEALLLLNRPKAREDYVTELGDSLEARAAAIRATDPGPAPATVDDVAPTETPSPD